MAAETSAAVTPSPSVGTGVILVALCWTSKNAVLMALSSLFYVYTCTHNNV